MVRIYLAWRQDINQVLLSIDRLQVQQMKLDKHFKSAETSKNYAVYLLCLRITRVKPSITPEVMINRKNFRDKFIEWAKAQKGDTGEVQQQVKPKSIADILGLKPYIAIPANVSAMLLDQLDIKSQQFRPQVFIAKAHGTLIPSDISRSIENLRKTASAKQIVMGKIITENTIIFGETRSFFDALKVNIAVQVSEGPAYSAHMLLSKCEATEGTYLSPLLKQRAEMERIKRLIQLTSKYSYLFKLPNTLQSHLSSGDIESIIDVYQKHVVVIKNYAHLPVFAKVVKNLDSVLAAVKTSILQDIRKGKKKISMEVVTRSIEYLNTLDPRGKGINDVAQVLYEVIDNYLESMWTRVDKQQDLPWLIKEHEMHSPGDSSLQQAAVEQLILRILDKVHVYIEILSKLSVLIQGKKIKRKLQKVSGTLTKKLSMSLFQDDSEEPLRLISIDELSCQIKKIAAILEVSSFQKFCEEFTISVIKTKFHVLQKEINELWKEEIWSKDYENKNGTCIPRVFFCMIIQVTSKLQETLPDFEENMLGYIGEGVGSCSLALLQAMKTALNSNSPANKFVSKSQRTLLTLSNTYFLTNRIFPQISAILEGLFTTVLPSQTQEALNVSNT